MLSIDRQEELDKISNGIPLNLSIIISGQKQAFHMTYLNTYL